MITRTLFPELRSVPVRAGAGVLALVLSVAPVSFAQSQAAPVASPTNTAPATPPATGVQAERAQVRSGQAPAGSAPGTAAPSTPAPAAPAPAAPGQAAPPAAQTAPPAAAAGETTRASAEADAANRDMQAELEPTPGGLTAEEIIRAAFENSPTLAKSNLEFDKAAANQARAKLAFAPRFDVSAGYTRLSKITQPQLNFGFPIETQVRPEALIPDRPMVDPDQPSLFQPILNQYNVSASVSLPVTEIFLTVIPTYKATQKLKQVADLQREAQKLQISYDSRVAFYEYARLRGSASVARASVRVREAGVRDLESLVQAGTATGTELVRAQAELAGARALEIQAVGGVEVALARLEQLTGTHVDANRGIGEPFVGIEIGDTPSIESVRTEAKNARPELLALIALEGARNKLLSARKGALYPKIQGRGAVLYASPNPRYIPPSDKWRDTYEAGVSVSWSPNDFALAYTQTTDAETDLKTVHEDRRAFEQGIVVESAAAVTGHRTAAEQISARTQALEAARRYEADQRALLLAGAATPNDVLLAQRDLLAASLEWVNAFIAGRVAQAALLKAQGKTGLAN